MEHGPSYEEGPVWSDNNAVQRAVEKKADDLGKKLSRALGRIFKF
jgi:hypothetical protein